MRNFSTNRHAKRVVPVLVAIVLIASGCGGGTDAKTGTTSAPTKTPIDAPASSFADMTNTKDVTVKVYGNQYWAPYIVITAGTKVTWTVTEDATHNVLPIDDGAFVPSGDLEQNDSYSFTFDDVGDFGYYCSHHGTKTSGQRGGVRVVAAR